MLITFVIILFTCLLLGFPIIFPLLASALFLFFTEMQGMQPMMLIQQFSGGVSSFVLLAIPMFIFAGEIMSRGEISDRLVNFVQAFVGHLSGGLAITTAGACTLFGSISGSTQATIAAIGRPMRKKMLSAGYKDEEAIGLIINASDIAVLIPPSSIMIMYAVVTGTSVGDLFMAGVGPGILMFIGIAIYSYISAKKNNVPLIQKFTLKEKLHATKESLLALGFPVLVLGGIYSGIFSPTEGSAVAVLYAFIVEVFIYRSITLSDIVDVAISTAKTTTVVFVLVAAGAVFSWVISFAQVPAMITSTLLGDAPSVFRILVVINVIFFIGCMFVDSLVLITVVTPIFFPIAMAAGIDPVLLGIIITMQSAIGCATPPFGCNIFTACALFNAEYTTVIKKTWYYIAILLVVTVLIMLVPDVSLGLVRLLK